jgi:hypothetical protein
MAAINSMVFDQAAYRPGQAVTLTVDYTPDTPGMSSHVFTATFTLADVNGSVVASQDAPFTVNTPQPGDKGKVTDDGSHTWDEVSDSGTVAVFTTSV